MMKQLQNFILLLPIISLILISCGSQEKVVQSIECKEQVVVQYENASAQAKKEGLEANKKRNSFVVFFLNDFNHQVKGFVNDELLFDENISTNSSTSDTNKYFGYEYTKDKTAPVLKVSIPSENKCFDIEIDKRYKLIYVFLTREGNFIVRFSNQHYIHN